MGAIQEVHAIGQSLWYDNIQRRLLQNGQMAGMIERGEIRGMTSNPTIFNNAIAKSNDYDEALIPLAQADWSPEAIYGQLTLEDIQAAAALFRPLYEKSNKGDGYVSLEVSPLLAHDSAGTLAEALRLWQAVDRPNLMIKIPATKEGLPAIQKAIAAGLNVNVTLIFSLERYQEVMEAYIAGLEERVSQGLPIAGIASVASFFVSRVDGKIDARLPQGSPLLGKAAIANAKLAFELFEKVFGTERFGRLQQKGARKQRPLWASTSTKNPAYRDVMYVEELIGENTVNTVPPQTLEAFRDHGKARLSIYEGLAQAREDLIKLENMGISMKQVTDELEAEGVKSFADAYNSLLATIDQRKQAVRVNK